MEKDEESGHYVYLFRDAANNPRYVGYGKTPQRATSHISRSHNEKLYEFLKSKRYSIEIAGPFNSKACGLAIETSLMSILKPEFNVAHGSRYARFRPLGVPPEFAVRGAEAPLNRSDFTKAAKSVLFVRLNDKAFEDGRVGYDPSKPPTNKQILKRMDRWWQLAPHVKPWLQKPSSGPTVLIAVHGSPGAQIIVGSVQINIVGWADAERDKTLYMVPTIESKDLDFLQWRGRKISKDANLRFGPFRRETFIILEQRRIIGGHSSLHDKPNAKKQP